MFILHTRSLPRCWVLITAHTSLSLTFPASTLCISGEVERISATSACLSYFHETDHPQWHPSRLQVDLHYQGPVTVVRAGQHQEAEVGATVVASLAHHMLHHDLTTRATHVLLHPWLSEHCHCCYCGDSVLEPGEAECYCCPPPLNVATGLRL